MFRVILASLLGALTLFIAGAFSHMALELESRAMFNLPNEEATKSHVSQQQLLPGIYSFPGMNRDWQSIPIEQQSAEMEKYSAEYKNGPTGFVIVVPNGEEPMSAKQLIGEFIANIGVALVASLFMVCMKPSISFWKRWFLLVLLAPASWLSLTFSHWLWYRFSFPFVLDGLYCALIEWALAGIVIAAIARPASPPEVPMAS